MISSHSADAEPEQVHFPSKRQIRRCNRSWDPVLVSSSKLKFNHSARAMEFGKPHAQDQRPGIHADFADHRILLCSDRPLS